MSAKARYRDFCRTAPDVPVFAQPWYLDACAEGGTWDVVLAEEKGRVVAALPYFYKQKGPVSVRHDAALCEMAGALPAARVPGPAAEGARAAAGN